MRKLIVLLMAVLTMLSLTGLSFAQNATAEPSAHGQAAELSKAQMPAAAKLHHFMGEVVAADQTAKTVTIRHMVRGKPKEATFTVEEQAASTLADLKPGDRVRVSYHKMGGQLIANTILETYHKASK
jgi:Cu/Ag efflux protein CusF